MNRNLISLLIILFPLFTSLQAKKADISISDVLQDIQSIQKELLSLQADAKKIIFQPKNF